MEKVDALNARLDALTVLVTSMAISLPDPEPVRQHMKITVRHMEASLLAMAIPDEAIAETLKHLYRNLALLDPLPPSG